MSHLLVSRATYSRRGNQIMCGNIATLQEMRSESLTSGKFSTNYARKAHTPYGMRIKYASAENKTRKQRSIATSRRIEALLERKLLRPKEFHSHCTASWRELNLHPKKHPSVTGDIELARPHVEGDQFESNPSEALHEGFAVLVTYSPVKADDDLGDGEDRLSQFNQRHESTLR